MLMLTITVTLIFAGSVYISGQDKPTSASGSAQVTKAVGVIKTIQADSITVTTESGGEVTAKLTGTTKILRVPPGEKDLKNATALQAQDLQPGDRVLVRGQASTSGDAQNIVALAVIVMKQADVVAKKQNDLADWQKRGVDGVVSAVDTATGVVTISPGRIGANKSIAIHVAKNTVLRRYAPGSVQFDDAKPAPIDQIKIGDQVRARGTRSPDGSELSAEEMVSGSFPNIAGIIKAIDAANNTITVQDAISKSAVVVKLAPDSQLQKLSAETAQHIAMRLKAATGGASGDQPGNGQGQGQGQGAGNGQSASSGAGTTRPPASTDQQAGRGAGGAPGGNGSPDLQRMLSHVPTITLADLQKGDAVVILAIAGANSESVTAIKLLAGVEAILTAAPNRNASSLLSPWSLGAAGGEGEAAQQ